MKIGYKDKIVKQLVIQMVLLLDIFKFDSSTNPGANGAPKRVDTLPMLTKMHQLEKFPRGRQYWT